MSYLHCPTCKRAFNMATSATCPSCPIAATLVDPAEDIVAATEQLARAMARATPGERDDAMARMDRLALPAPGAKPVTFHGAMIRSIREALDPPVAAPRKQPLFERLATKVVAELAPHMVRFAPRARRVTDRVMTRARALLAA